MMNFDEKCKKFNAYTKNNLYVPLYYVSWYVDLGIFNSWLYERKWFFSEEERLEYIKERGWKWWEHLPFIRRTFCTDLGKEEEY